MRKVKINTLPRYGKNPTTSTNFCPSSPKFKPQNYTKVLANRLISIFPKISKMIRWALLKPITLLNSRSLRDLIIKGKFTADAISAPLMRVHWRYMFESFKLFCINCSFLPIISALYSCSSTTILVNGILSKSFQITNGIYQVFRLSHLIFFIVMNQEQSLNQLPRNGTPSKKKSLSKMIIILHS